MHVAAILAAGGKGLRIGGDLPKQFLELADGQIMLLRSLETIGRCALVEEVVVAIPADWHGSALPETPGLKPLTFVQGGSRRQDSVANALAAVSDRADLIVIHDAARPFVTTELIERTIRAAEQHGAAVAAIPVRDTIKQADELDADGSRLVRQTLPRETIFLAQTPQAFRRDVLTRVLIDAPDVVVTDEAMLFERAGLPVHLVEGDPRNFKITTLDDLETARALVRTERMSAGHAPRIGTGYDLHRLVAGRPLILAGVRIPFELGLEGHSDADIVCHAVTDAILGAATAGDIGRMFPDTDPAWKDADSVQLLRQAAGVVRAAGYVVANVDVTVIAEQPKLLPHLEAMRANLADALGIEPGAVSIKGKTNEKIGEIGRGEAMACHAVALLSKT